MESLTGDEIVSALVGGNVTRTDPPNYRSVDCCGNCDHLITLCKCDIHGFTSEYAVCDDWVKQRLRS